MKNVKRLSVAIALIIIASVCIVYFVPTEKDSFLIYEFTDEETKLIELKDQQQLNNIEILDWDYTKQIEQPKTRKFYTQDTEDISEQNPSIISFMEEPYEYEILKTKDYDKVRLEVPKYFYKTEGDLTYKYTTNYLKLKIDISEPKESINVKADYNPSNPDYDYVIITNGTYWDILNNDFKDWKISTDSKISSIWIVNVSTITSNSDYWVNGTYGDATNTTGGNPWIADGKEITADYELFNDTQCKIRNFIRFCVTDHNVDYILLGGNKNIVPPRMVCSNASGDECFSYDSDISHASDMYYSNLHYCMNNNTNSYWMENECCSYTWDEIDWGFDVLVGRALCGTPTELHNWINKTKAYVDGNNDSKGNYLKCNMNSCKDIGNSISNQTWTGWWQVEGIFGPGIGDEFPSNMTWVNGKNITQTQWEQTDDYVSGNIENFDGINIIYHAGHGGTLFNTLGATYQPTLCENAHIPQFVYTEGCHSGDFGTDTGSRAEIWCSYNGSYSSILNSASGWFVASTYFGEEMMSRMFNETRGIGETNFLQAHNDARETIGHSDSDGVFAMIYKETNYFGDPSLDWNWYSPTYSPSTDANQIISINGNGNRTNITDPTPTFNWTTVSNVSQYNLLIAEDSTFTSITVNLTDVNEYNYPTYYSENETNVLFILPETNVIPSFGQYYVKVKANVK